MPGPAGPGQRRSHATQAFACIVCATCSSQRVGCAAKKEQASNRLRTFCVNISRLFASARRPRGEKSEKQAEDLAPFARLIAVSVTSATMQRGSRCMTRNDALEFQRILHILSRHRREDRMHNSQFHTETQACYLSSSAVATVDFSVA
jgi:hypothetical protein